MAKNRKSYSGRVNNRKSTDGRIHQIIYSEKKKVFVGMYLTPKGQKLLDEGKISKSVAEAKYGKKKYRINPNAIPVKIISHDPPVKFPVNE
jgi:hypothetical protein